MAGGLSVEGIGFRYGRREALAGVCLAVPRGRFCALLGPNGAGKSTLLALITGLFATRTGRIAIDGHDIRGQPRAALARLGVVFQQQTLDLDLTVRRNLLYFAGLHGLGGRDAARRVDAALDRLAMRERAGEPARALNGGHRRRMEIARALLHEPSVLVLDEPTVGLDAASRAAITAHVHELAAGGLAVLWATHLVDEIGEGDDLVVLDRGRVVACGPVAAVRGDRPLVEAYLSLTARPADAEAGP